MSSIRLLHVDDDPDIREIVAMALGLDPDFSTEGCASGADALDAASRETPDLILLDVMMPGMDGPTTLAHLRQNAKTANIPVVFMTARAQMRELQHFMSLGAAGVISKPFDPMTLAGTVRSYSQAARLAPLRFAFVLRARKDALALAACRKPLADQTDLSDTLAEIRTIAHGLSGAAGIYGFADIRHAASDLENDVIAGGEPGRVAQAIDTLLGHLAALADGEVGSTLH